MSITKLRDNYRDGVVKGERKYALIENQDDTVSFVSETEFIMPEFSVDSSMLNEINDTANQVIDLAEENATLVEELVDDFDDIVDGTTKIKKATQATHATQALTVTSATSADSAENDFFLITRQRLNFTNNTLTIYDNRITADSLADIYFTEDTASYAKSADIDVTTDTIRATVTAKNTPTGDVVATIKVRTV